MSARGAVMMVLALVAAAGRTDAAFETTGDDPATLARSASGPAWPLDGRPSADMPGVFGEPPQTGLLLSTGRWEAAPGLRKDRVTAWTSRGSACAVVRLSRLALESYSETHLGLEIARPTAPVGWGWALAAGRESWSALELGAAGWVLSAHLGFAPRSDFRAAVRIVEHAGGAASDSESLLELGITADPMPGWRFGAGYETSRGGGFGRMKLGLECRPGRGLTLRMGMLPSESTISLGIGLGRGPVGIDVGRRTHPRLGATQALGLIIGGRGRDRQ